MLTFGSVCDGIGCGHLAFVNAGYKCVWSAEIEPFPCSVLEYRFPDVRNHGDMNLTAGLVESGEIEAPDVFIGGTPCQAFSVAGKRKGLKDARGNLSLTFCGIADAIDDVRRRDGKQPCVVLWENVPGVLSDEGNAFGCFLGELAGSGCQLQPAGDRWENAGCVFGPERTVAWRVLDSQWFGVAQRRKRVFVVASAGERTRPEEILFEREGVRRDTAPSREAWQGFTHDLAQCLTSSGRGVERCGETRGQDPVVAVSGVPDICGCPSDGAHNGGGLNGQDAYSGRIIPCQTYDMRGNGDGETVGTLTGDHAGRPTDYTPVVAFKSNAGTEFPSRDDNGDVCGCLQAENGHAVATQMQVRRLTPVECERLQGLPDGHTLIPWRGKPASECPDGPRYKGIGNGQTVQVMQWLAKRISTVIERQTIKPCRNSVQSAQEREQQSDTYNLACGQADASAGHPDANLSMV